MFSPSPIISWKGKPMLVTIIGIITSVRLSMLQQNIQESKLFTSFWRINLSEFNELLRRILDTNIGKRKKKTRLSAPMTDLKRTFYYYPFALFDQPKYTRAKIIHSSEITTRTQGTSVNWVEHKPKEMKTTIWRNDVIISGITNVSVYFLEWRAANLSQDITTFRVCFACVSSNYQCIYLGYSWPSYASAFIKYQYDFCKYQYNFCCLVVQTRTPPKHIM